MSLGYTQIKTMKTKKIRLNSEIENIEVIDNNERIFHLIDIVLLLFTDIKFDKNTNEFQVIYKTGKKSHNKDNKTNSTSESDLNSKLDNSRKFIKILKAISHCRIEQLTDTTFRIL